MSDYETMTLVELFDRVFDDDGSVVETGKICKCLKEKLRKLYPDRDFTSTREMFQVRPYIRSMTNPEPTEIEKALFHYAGYYPIHRELNYPYGSVIYVRYVVVHCDRDGYPLQLDILKKDVEEDSYLELYLTSNTVKISGMFDIRLVGLVQELLKSYGYQ